MKYNWAIHKVNTGFTKSYIRKTYIVYCEHSLLGKGPQGPSCLMNNSILFKLFQFISRDCLYRVGVRSFHWRLACKVVLHCFSVQI